MDSFLCVKAISNPAEEYQEKARDAVFPLVHQLRRYYDFSLEIGIVFALFKINLLPISIFLCT